MAIASGLDFSPRITSTSGMRGTGLKKCIPQKLSGRFRAVASRVIEMVEVFEVRIGALRQEALDLGQDLLLDRLVLDHGLDDEVHGAEVAVGERGGDAGQHLRHLAGRELPALDLLLEELHRLAHARSRAPSGRRPS